MTGLFARLRAWLGGGSESDDEDDSAPSSERPESRVAHRDDRPLETPATVERPEPTGTPSGGGAPDATPRAAATDEPTVSIPDAEATAGASETDDAVPTTGGTAAEDGGGERDAAEAEAEAPTDADLADAPADGTVACSVCGTTVDDPSEPCPLCRSTDVVPVADADDGADAEDAEPFTRGSRTAMSTADDEAVDRLRDVRKGE